MTESPRCKINPSFTPTLQSHGMSFAAPTSPSFEQTPRNNSVAHSAEHKEEEAWSGDEDEDADGDGDGGDDESRKRKRQRLSSRPLSVSCELCKSRKVNEGHETSFNTSTDALVRSSAIAVSPDVDGAFAMARTASTESARSLGCVLATAENLNHD